LILAGIFIYSLPIANDVFLYLFYHKFSPAIENQII